MKIAIVAPSGVPFVMGGAERLWLGLAAAINRDTEHDADIIKLPSREFNTFNLVWTYRAFNDLDLSHFDLVVSTKYPAWMVRHPNHVVYLQHTLRGLYDTYHFTGLPLLAEPTDAITTELIGAIRSLPPGHDDSRSRVMDLAQRAVTDLPGDHPDLRFPGPLVRELVRWFDADALSPRRIRRHLAISRTVARRVGYFPTGVDPIVVPHPSNLTDFRSGPGTGFFTASRLDGPKRIGLLIDAMAHVPGDVTLRIAGTGPDEERLRRLAAGDHRISFLGAIGDDALLDEYAAALAVPFVPADEDMGLITLEAQRSGKAVITCRDSGGSVEFVEHDRSGLVVDPTPAALGAALAHLAAHPDVAARMGEAGRRHAEGVTWRRVIEALVAKDAPRAAHRRKVVVLSTFGFFPAQHGGQIRSARLYGALTELVDVHAVTLDDGGSVVGDTEPEPGFRQQVVAAGPELRRVNAQLSAATGVPAGDVAAALTVRSETGYLEALRQAVDGADAVILAHPYLWPALDEIRCTLPVVYDAHNAEFRLKRTMYPRNAVGDALVDAVAAVESRAVAAARTVVACSEEDAEALAALAPTLADRLVIPNGADIGAYEFVTGPDRRRRRDEYLAAAREAVGSDATRLAVFLGSAHGPNVEAARVVLRVADELPDVLFVLIGGHSDLLGGVVTSANVLVRGKVPTAELTLLLSACDVALNPMLSGSGTNVKALDYLAAGAPVVATPTGMRGLPVLDGEHALVVDADGLAGAIRATLADPTAADRRAARGREVAERFDWRRLGETLRAAVASAVTAVPAPPPAQTGE